MALSAERNTPERAGQEYYAPMAADVKAYAGGIAVRDSAGNVKPGETATGLIPCGRFEETVDNTDGLAAAKSVRVKDGVFRWANSAGADEIAKAQIGDTCYIVDDQTVAKTSATNTRSPAGIIVDVDSYGVWVATPYVLPSVGLTAANNLSDVAAAATACTNLGLGTTNDVTFKSVTSTGQITGLSKFDTKTATYTVTAADGGAVFIDATDNAVITLPDAAAANKGLKVTVINAAADGEALISISPHSSDKIYGTIGSVSFGGVAGKDIQNTKATANKGDFATLVSDGATGWYVIGGVGVWASEG